MPTTTTTQPSELANLTEKDLILTDVDTSFLPMLHELAASSRGHDSSTKGTRPCSSSSQRKDKGGEEAEKAEGESLPSLSQLLASHGLLKLLPQVRVCICVYLCA
jgi:hypothetical protein